MGSRGVPSSAPGGYGSISAKGYRRVWDVCEKRYRMEHVMVWESANGKVPHGHDVHHKNGDKLDNRLENLELLSKVAHKRDHGGCELVDGVWFKPCRKCGAMLNVSEYYKRKDGISPWCKGCCIENAVANKRKRRAKEQA